MTECIQNTFEEVNNGNYANFQQYLIENNITELDLSSGKAFDVDPYHLGRSLKNTNVITLLLGNNHFSDEDMIALIQGLAGSKVTTLDLERNLLTHRGAEDFAKNVKNTNISSLSLAGNTQLTATGVVALCKGLKGSQIIKLNLNGNNLGENSGSFPLLCEALKDTYISFIDFRFNGIKQNDLKILAQLIKNTHLVDVNLQTKNPLLENALTENRRHLLTKYAYITQLPINKDIQTYLLQFLPFKNALLRQESSLSHLPGARK